VSQQNSDPSIFIIFEDNSCSPLTKTRSCSRYSRCLVKVSVVMCSVS